MNRHSSRQQQLVEGRTIADLEKVAEAYADICDRRIALKHQEATLKLETMRLMKKHKKKHYARDGIEITLEPGEETIKVKVKKAKDDDGEDDA